MTHAEQEHGIRHHAAAPETGGFLDLYPDLRWLRLPLPFELGHINVWLLAEADGWTLVDTGLNADVARAAWQRLFNTALQGRPLQRIVVTHYHPDHMGLAQFLWDAFQPQLLMTAATESRTRSLLQGARPGQAQEIAAYCRRHGIEQVEQYTAYITGAGYRNMVAGLPPAVTQVAGGVPLRLGGHDWQPIIANGHAPGHLSLYCAERGLLIAGDQVLPGISANISVQANNRDEDALQAYLQSMQCFTALDPETTVLPAHGPVFTGLHERVTGIIEHHQIRLQRLLALCEQPLCLAEVAPRLFRKPLQGIDYVLALGEAMSHLVYLLNRGELRTLMDGEVQRFVRA